MTNLGLINPLASTKVNLSCFGRMMLPYAVEMEVASLLACTDKNPTAAES